MRGYYITKIGKFVLVISGIFRLLCNIKDSFFPIHAAAVDFSFPDVVKF